MLASAEVGLINEAGKTSDRLTNDATSPFRLWMLVSAVGFTVMALTVSVVENTSDTHTHACIALVLNFISHCVLAKKKLI